MKKRLRKDGRPVRLDQWIEITRENGQTVSTFYPPNAEFQKLMHEMDPQPDLLYRYLNFVHGVPSEYNWVEPTVNFRLYGGLFLQRVLPSDWPHIKWMESLAPGHHVQSAPNPQPRPAAWGPCPCARCAHERETGAPSRFRDAPALFTE